MALATTPTSHFVKYSSHLPGLATCTVFRSLPICPCSAGFSKGRALKYSRMGCTFLAKSLSSMVRMFSAEVTIPAVASNLRLNEFRTNFVTGWYKSEESAARYSVRLFTVLNRKSYRMFNRLSIRSFYDCQPSICRVSSLLFFLIGKSVRSRDILLLHPLFEFLHVETQGTPTLDTRYHPLAG